MKKFKVLFILFAFSIFLSSCYDPGIAFKRYPWYKADTWYCEEIDMTINFSVDESGDITKATYSQLAIGDMIYEVGIAFQVNAISFLHDLDGDGISKSILDGTWSYRGENMVIQIHEESIFSGQYKELIFVPSEQ